MRTRIFSDLHLGHTASRLTDHRMLEPVLEGVDRVILAGDVWQQRQAGEVSLRGRKLLDQLLELMEKRGIAFELLRGNHDPEGGGGVSWLADRKVLVTHGDAIYETATPWSRQISVFRDEVEEIVAKYAAQSSSAEACADRAREIAQAIGIVPLPNLPTPLDFFATALWPPSRPFEMVRVWFGMWEEGLQFLAKSGDGARVLVCGHFHRAGFRGKEGRLIVNTGSFMRGSRAWTVDLNENKLTARSLELQNGEYQLGAIKGRWLIDGARQSRSGSSIEG